MKARSQSMKRIATIGAATLAAAAIAVPTAGAKALPTGPADATPSSETTSAGSEGPNWPGIGIAAGFAVGLAAFVRSARRQARGEKAATDTAPAVSGGPPRFPKR
jgi:hypothetical protein